MTNNLIDKLNILKRNKNIIHLNSIYMNYVPLFLMMNIPIVSPSLLRNDIIYNNVVDILIYVSEILHNILLSVPKQHKNTFYNDMHYSHHVMTKLNPLLYIVDYNDQADIDRLKTVMKNLGLMYFGDILDNLKGKVEIEVLEGGGNGDDELTLCSTLSNANIDAIARHKQTTDAQLQVAQQELLEAQQQLLVAQQQQKVALVESQTKDVVSVTKRLLDKKHMSNMIE